MTEAEAIQQAREIATENQWTWLEPVAARLKKRWFGTAVWVVCSNADHRGCNVRIEIEDVTRRVLSSAFCPR